MNEEVKENDSEGRLTKAERKQQRREEKQKERDRQIRAKARKKMISWAVLVIIVIAVIGGSVGIVGNGGDGSNGTIDSEGNESALKVAVSDADWIKGNRESTIELVEYGDFQCPACGHFHPIIKDLENEFGDRVKFVFRHFPLKQPHPNAEPAAIAAEAAGKQGKFWEMHDLLFERQEDWSQGNPDDKFLSYAEEIGLNRESFESDIKDKSLAQKVDDQYTGGIRSKVDSTPSFYLNGDKVEGVPTRDEFKEIIEQAIGENQ